MLRDLCAKPSAEASAAKVPYMSGALNDRLCQQRLAGRPEVCHQVRRLQRRLQGRPDAPRDVLDAPASGSGALGVLASLEAAARTCGL